MVQADAIEHAIDSDRQLRYCGSVTHRYCYDVK
jgi:hypothetical protein